MLYSSTRSNEKKVQSSTAIAQGISEEGGLFVPEFIPTLSYDNIKAMCKMSYVEKAEYILSKFLTDFSTEELKNCVENAYGSGKFDSEEVAPLSKLNDSTYILELWHGPTCAFKDMALQLLPHLLTTAVKKTGDDSQTVILVATSGDTGKAALEGFKDVENTKIIVFYPSDGVSPMQKLQMATQEGENVSVCAIKGNFDDAQSGVKNIFTDPDTKARLLDNKMKFSSANSINWGRLVPQIVYYFSAYCRLLEDGEISDREAVNVVVPTGNFGNILAAYYAKFMGLPIKKLICASNSNNVLTDFINSGEYDRNREFFATISPSMDILISSNLERLLYHVSDSNCQMVKELMDALKTEGKYKVSDELKAKICDLFAAGYCDEESTQATIKSLYETYSYLCDTHTAVAVSVYNDYVKETADNTKTIIASTASAYKFPYSVLSCIADAEGMNDFEMLEKLSVVTKTDIPESIVALKEKNVRFNTVISKEDMSSFIADSLNLK